MARKPFRHLTVIALFALLPGLEASADIKAVTTDGRHVVLKDDNTWEFIEIEAGDPSVSAVLSVEDITALKGSCTLDLKLQNNLGYKIKSLVPRFSVYNKGGILFESKSKSFSQIKPTRYQFRKLQFIGIDCPDIAHIKVHDAHHCNMGDLDKYNYEDGACLRHIYVQPSDLINMSK